MNNRPEKTKDSKRRWNKNADFWDEKMGEQSNRFHREIIRPDTEKLLDIKKGDNVLDIACGNGNFSKRLVELGANVTAIDYSVNMIENAKKRCADYIDNINFSVIDVTKDEELKRLDTTEAFDKAVCNMALMDISDIRPLVKEIFKILKSGGIFVFSVMHPCFQPPDMRKIKKSDRRLRIQLFKYIKSECFKGEAIRNQPVEQLYFHRPLNVLLNTCFKAGFVMNGIAEPVFKKKVGDKEFDWYNIPPAIIVRLVKK